MLPREQTKPGCSDEGTIASASLTRRTNANTGHYRYPFVLAFRQSYTAEGAASAPRRIETTSCAVDAEGHLSAILIAEVVTTFSSFQVP